MRNSRLTDVQVIRAMAHNEKLREPARGDDDFDVLSFVDDEDCLEPDVDETWEYMTDLLEAGEIDFDSFRHQLLSVGYSEEEIAGAQHV